MRRLLTALVAIVLGLLVVPLQAGPPAPIRGGTLTFGIQSDWKTLDPVFYTNVSERMIFYSFYNPLVSMDEQMTVRPELVSSWDVSKDGLTWTFHLQPGVVFHDGTDFNAEAVKFNLDRIRAPETGSTLRTLLEPVQEVRVKGPLTVEVSLKTPFTPLLGLLTEGPGFTVSPAAVKKYGKDYSLHPVGTGPFEFVDWQKGDQIRVRRFDRYWEKGLPHLDGVTYRPIPDESVRLANLQAGALDVSQNVPPRSIAAVRQDKQLKTFVLVGTRWPMIRFNLARGAFTEKALRQAVAYAINRDQLVAAIYFGNARPAFGPITPVYSTIYDSSIREFSYSTNLDRAREKLREAGKPTGFTFSLDIAASPDQARMAELIKAQLTQVGITMNVQSYEPTTFQDRLTYKRYEAALGSWTPRPDVDGTIWNHFHSNGNVNSMSYKNPAVDELLDRARSLPNGPARIKAYRDAQRLIVADAPWAFLIFENIMVAMKPGIYGIPTIPDTMIRFKTAWMTK
jgi:peptide/nickel transport system substrate-binding protein